MITSRYRYFLLSAILLMILPVSLSTCKKDPELPSGNNQFQFGTTTIDSVSYRSIKLTTNVANTGGHSITEYGHCWSVEENPDLSDSITKSTGTPSNQKFTNEILNLEPNTKYYIRGYCKLDNGTVFTGGISQTTLKTGKPVVLTQNIFDVTVTTAKCEGEVTSDSGLIVTERGVCWDLDEDFGVSANLGKSAGGAGIGKYTCQVNLLQEGKTYYIKAYSTNEAGVSYGETKSFVTVSATLPTVETADITEVTTTTALSGGNVTDAGNSIISARGICWGLNPVPTLEECLGYTNEGSGEGIFSSPITGLTEGTSYYVRAYATNEKGTGYGEDKNFQTVSINLPSVTTADVINITSSSAECGGNVTSSGNGTITVKGVCWGTSAKLTLENSLGSTNDGNGLGAFTSEITGLTSGVNYYVRAYATNENGTGYGPTLSFYTLTFPTVLTAEVLYITTTSAQCGGEVTSSGYGNISVRGVCWGTSPNPALGNCLGYTTDGSGTGTFTSAIIGLASGNLYYVRAYATNEVGTSYGSQKSFNTPTYELPEVTTAGVTNVTPTSSKCGGEVTSAGSGTVSARGVCWSTSSNPTLGNCLGFTTDGSGVGFFSSEITGLASGATYYVRAYASSQYGTTYGGLEQFTTTGIVIPTVVTLDVTNMTSTTAESGGNVTNTGNGTVTTRGVCWSNDPNPSLGNCIGSTNNGSGAGSYVSIMTGLTPGSNYYVRAYATNEAGTAYGADKPFSTTTTSPPVVTTAEVINITSTTAQSGGEVLNAGNGNVSARGVCWNTTQNPTLTNCLGFTTNGSGLGVFTSDITGLSSGTEYYVRAYGTNEYGTGYGDNEPFSTTSIVTPSVTTGSVINISAYSAESGGEVTSSGNGNVISRGVCWDTIPNPSLINNLGFTIDGYGVGTFTSIISGLNENSFYYLRAYATNEVGTSYGNEETFSTPEFICGQTITYGGQIYNTIEIGNQCWFKENLNIGLRIDGIEEQTDNQIIEKYCYDDDIASCSAYGGLYQWNEVMQYDTVEGNDGICPNGWHIPTDGQLCILTKYVDPTVNCNYFGWSGVDAGYKLKAVSGWNSGGNGSNSSGFTALPAGMRNISQLFHNLGNDVFYWSSSQTDQSNAFGRKLRFDYDNVARNDYDKGYGFSVRCIKE